MIRFCVRQAVRVFAGAAFFSCALGAQAASLTFSDPNCSSFSVQGSNGNYTLSCASLSCNVSSSAGTTITPGNGTTLTAVCSPSASSYSWSAGASNDANCPSPAPPATTANTWFISAPVSGGVPQTLSGCVYQVNATSTSQGGGAASTSLAWSNVTVSKPSQCSITSSPPSLTSAGGSVVLTATCAGPGAVDTWTWTGPIASSSGNTATSNNITVTTAFSVDAHNAGGDANPSISVNVATAGGTGGPGSCVDAQDGSGITGATNNMNMLWPNWTANTQGNMGPNDAIVVKFTTGATASSNIGKIVLFSGSGQDSAHDAYVSTLPCDFGQKTSKTLLPALKFTIGTRASSTIPVLAVNTTYYLNIRNSAGAVCLTPSLNITCSLVGGISFYKPPGL